MNERKRKGKIQISEKRREMQKNGKRLKKVES